MELNLEQSQESKEEGNNHPSSFRCRKYVFTLNNYIEEDVNNLKIYLDKSATKWIFGKEVGEQGTPHLQGYMEFKSQRKWESLCKLCPSFLKCWSTAAKGNLEQNYDYTSKDGDYYYGGFSIDKVKYTIKIDLYDWQKKIIEELKQKPDDRTINWIWEPKGCAGKTTFQKYIYEKFKNVCVISGKSADMKNGIIQFIKVKEETPDIVLINIPRCQDTEYISYEGIESIKDMFFFSGKYEGGQVWGPPPHVWIFANMPPPVEKLSSDRWNVTKI